MFNLANVPPVSPDELLARFVLFSRHIRSSDLTVKPEAFMPHPSVELSMTRHTQATPEEIWAEGTRVANLRSKTLYGRADVAARAITQQSLVIEAAPIPENPNHVNALHWPEDKAVQKIKALGRVD